MINNSNLKTMKLTQMDVEEFWSDLVKDPSILITSLYQLYNLDYQTIIDTASIDQQKFEIKVQTAKTSQLYKKVFFKHRSDQLLIIKEALSKFLARTKKVTEKKSSKSKANTKGNSIKKVKTDSVVPVTKDTTIPAVKRYMLKTALLSETANKHLSATPRNERSDEIVYILENKTVSRKYDLSKSVLKTQTHYTYDPIKLSEEAKQAINKEKAIRKVGKETALAAVINDACRKSYQETIPTAPSVEGSNNVIFDFKSAVYDLLGLNQNEPEELVIQNLRGLLKKAYEKTKEESAAIILKRKAMIDELTNEVNKYESLLELSESKLNQL